MERPEKRPQEHPHPLRSHPIESIDDNFKIRLQKCEKWLRSPPSDYSKDIGFYDAIFRCRTFISESSSPREIPAVLAELMNTVALPYVKFFAERVPHGDQIYSYIWTLEHFLRDDVTDTELQQRYISQVEDIWPPKSRINPLERSDISQQVQKLLPSPQKQELLVARLIFFLRYNDSSPYQLGQSVGGEEWNNALLTTVQKFITLHFEIFWLEGVDNPDE